MVDFYTNPLIKSNCKNPSDTHNPVTNPAHYDMQPRPADVIMSWGLSWARGNVLKYIVRAGKKDGNTAVQDLEKAIQCLRMEIEWLKNQDKHEFWKAK